MRILDPLDEIKFDLPEQDKVAFKLACTLTDTTMARELRRFIRWYIRSQKLSGDVPRLPEFL